ncbi:MAG: alpha/beta hydrolase [Gemmatimonas sp.]
MATGLTATVAFVLWCVVAYRATSDARVAMKSDGQVVVEPDGEVIRFSSVTKTDKVPVGLLFIAGSLVDPVAYAPLARAVAAAGFPVILVKLPRRGAFGGADSPEVLLNALSAIHEDERAWQWLIGGHSRGAVVASRMVSELAELGARSIAGLLLVGTSHPRDVDLSRYKRPVTKIYATRDGLASVEKIEANRRLLPSTTRWVRIEGGNHSQFGWYGFQPGDHFATISADAQHTQLITAVLESLRLAGDPRRTQPPPMR